MAVMHFCDFDVEGLIPKNRCGLASEVEEEVYASGVVRGKDDGDGLGGFGDGEFLLITVASGADHEGDFL